MTSADFSHPFPVRCHAGSPDRPDGVGDLPG